MSEVKFYRITGYMLISINGLNERRKFVKEVRAVSPRDAVEIVYSEIGGNHKVKRKNIEIVEIKELTLDEVKSKSLRTLAQIERLF